MSIFKRVMLVVSIGLFSFSGFASSFVVSMNQPLDCEHYQCIGVVDAGSTGSRLHLYTYDLNQNNAPINIVEHWSKKVKPGLATLNPDQVSIDTYLNNLFAQTPNLQHFPIYFYATAGMRLLSQPKQNELFGYLKNWFSRQEHWKLMEAKTISGREEGIYAWLSVNYQLGSLEQANSHLVGVMDMGGASVQIAFPTADADQLNAEDIQEIDLYGHHYTVFVHSFLGLGQTEVTHQFLNATSCFSSHYPLPDNGYAEGDAFSCQRDISVFVNSVHHVRAVVEPTLRMNDVSKWYAIGGVSDLIKSKPFSLSEEGFSGQALLNQGNVLCHRDWASLQGDFPGDDYLFGDCLFSAYYYALMVDGYGLAAEQTLHVLSPEYTPDWTIGAVLMKKSLQ